MQPLATNKKVQASTIEHTGIGGIRPKIKRTALVFYTVVGTDGETAQALGLVVLHVHIGKRDQPGVPLKRVLAGFHRWIGAGQQEVEVFDLVEGLTGEARLLLFLRHLGEGGGGRRRV